MAAKKLTLDQQHRIALEAIVAVGSNTGSTQTVAANHGVSNATVEQLLRKGLEGLKSTFYGNPDLSSGIKTLTSLIEKNNKTEDTVKTSESPSSAAIEPDKLAELVRQHNELVSEFNDKHDEQEAKPLIAITGGLYQKYSGLSTYEAKKYFDAHPELKEINDEFEISGDANKTLFRKYPDYDLQSVIKELSA